MIDVCNHDWVPLTELATKDTVAGALTIFGVLTADPKTLLPIEVCIQCGTLKLSDKALQQFKMSVNAKRALAEDP